MLGAGVLFGAALAATSAFAVTGSDLISPVAGIGVDGFAGDGGPALLARLRNPNGVATDGNGNVYIADTGNYRVRKVTPDGRIRTVAGNGHYGFTGDGGPATQARLQYVISVALDGHGNLYLADPGEDDVGTRIRKVDASGRITTFAGTATQGFAGDGGPATSAQLHTPTGVAADVAGNVYIADSGNHRVRKVSPAGTISTVAGNGQQATSGDGGPATAAGVSPFSVAADGQGSLYISDAVNGRLRKVDASGRITTLAAVDEPGGLAVDAQGNVYVADVRKNRIRKVTPAGALSTVAGRSRPPFTGDYGPATGARLQSPTSVALDAQGNLFIADALNQRIEKVGDVSVPGIGGGCSRATAKRLFQRLRLGNTGYTPNPVAQVVCGAFFGKGSRTMATSETIPSCGRTGGWEVFNFAQGAWHLVLHRNNGADLFRVRGGIKEQQFVLRPGDAHCFPTGGTRSRIWRWNGTHWVHTAWKYRRSKR